MSSRGDRAAVRRREWATKESLLEDDLCSLGPPSLLDAEEDEADGRETRGALVAAELDDAPTGVYAVPASVVFDASSAGETSPSTTRRLLVRNCGAKSVPVVVMRPESRRYDVRPAVASPHDERDAASALWEGAPAGAAVALRLIRPGETHLFIVTRRAALEEDLDAKEAEDEYDEYGQPRRRRRRRRGGAPLAPPAALYIFTRYFPLRVPLLVEGGSMAPPPSPRRGGPLEEARPRSMLSVCGPPPKLFEIIVKRARAEGRADDVVPLRTAPTPPQPQLQTLQQLQEQQQQQQRSRQQQSRQQDQAENASSKSNSDEDTAAAARSAPHGGAEPCAPAQPSSSSQFVARVDDAAAARAMLTSMRAKRSTARTLSAKPEPTPVPTRESVARAMKADSPPRRQQPAQLPAAKAGGGRGGGAAAPREPAEDANYGGGAADAEWVEREYQKRLEAAEDSSEAKRRAKRERKARKAKASSGVPTLANVASVGAGGKLRVAVKPGQRMRIAPPRRTNNRR